MKFLKLLAIFVLLFYFTLNATGATVLGSNKGCGSNVSFSIAKIWQSYSKKDKCGCNDEAKWKVGVQEYHDGCLYATLKYRGKPYDLAHIVMESFKTFLSQSMYYANSNSTILISSSTAILESMSKCARLGRSAMHIIIELDKVFLDVVNDLKNVATNLSEYIGADLSCSFKDAVDDLSCEFSKFMKNSISTGCLQKIEFVPSVKKCQKLMNTVALIAETLLNGCEAKIEVQEAVLVLTLIFWWFQIVVQGINSAVQNIMFDKNFAVTPTIKSVSISFDYVLVAIAEAVSVAVLPLTKTIGEFLGVFVNITLALNTALKDVLGLFDGVTVNVADITRNLFKNIRITSATNGRTNIVKGVTFK